MAWTVNETARGTSSRTTNGRRYTRVWRAETDGSSVHPAIAAGKAPVSVGSLFPSDPLARCTDVSAAYEREEESRLHYLVTATYETKTGSGSQEEENENPLDDTPVKRWSSRTVRLPVRVDINGQAIVNSAGEPFDPLPEEDFQVLVFEYQHNVLSYSETKASEYRGAVNNDNFILSGLPVKQYQARMQNITATSAERNGNRYWIESVTIEIVDDWRLMLVDEGRRRIADPADGVGVEIYLGENKFGQVQPVLDANGNPVEEPVLLDGQGGILQGGQPVLLTFDTAAKPLKPFNTLALPTQSNP
jgi:hypothetical protein